MYAKDKVTVVDKREMLRVKLKSLAAEAKFIQKEERRTYGAFRDELCRHRKTVVRNEARVTHLAYGLIRGRDVTRMERSSRIPPEWARVRVMITKYGPQGCVLSPDNIRMMKVTGAA